MLKRWRSWAAEHRAADPINSPNLELRRIAAQSPWPTNVADLAISALVGFIVAVLILVTATAASMWGLP